MTTPPSFDPKVFVVLTAAGSGTRLGQDEPKALVSIQGESLLVRAARNLAASNLVAKIVITAPQSHLAEFSAEFPNQAISGVPVAIVPGGNTRQDSVAAGLAHLAGYPEPIESGAGLGQISESSGEVKPDDIILVHDAARCFTPPTIVCEVVKTFRAGHVAVVPALPLTDTVKEVDGRTGPDGPQVELVRATPPRARLRAVQTPQGFRAEVLFAAHQMGSSLAKNDPAGALDDACLVEALGHPVVLIPGSTLSWKITTALDLALGPVLAQELDRIRQT